MTIILHFEKWEVEIEHLEKISSIFSNRFHNAGPLIYIVTIETKNNTEKEDFRSFETFKDFLLSLKGTSTKLSSVYIGGIDFANGAAEAYLKLDFIFGGLSQFYISQSKKNDWIFGFESEIKRYLSQIRIKTIPHGSINSEIRATFLENLEENYESKILNMEKKEETLTEKEQERTAVPTQVSQKKIEKKRSSKNTVYIVLILAIVVLVMVLAIFCNHFPSKISIPWLLQISYK